MSKTAGVAVKLDPSQGGKYSLTSHALKLTWFDLDKRSVDAALNAAFNAWRA
jgi:hypothetical protein